MASFKGAHFIKDIILTCVRWYVAYPLSYRQVEDLMQERGVSVDHAPINRWVLKYSPQLEEVFHRRRRPVRVSWRMEETYIRVKEEWRYLYRLARTCARWRYGGVRLSCPVASKRAVSRELTRAVERS
jgi:putative transposase